MAAVPPTPSSAPSAMTTGATAENIARGVASIPADRRACEVRSQARRSYAEEGGGRGCPPFSPVVTSMYDKHGVGRMDVSQIAIFSCRPR